MVAVVGPVRCAGRMNERCRTFVRSLNRVKFAAADAAAAAAVAEAVAEAAEADAGCGGASAATFVGRLKTAVEDEEDVVTVVDDVVAAVGGGGFEAPLDAENRLLLRFAGASGMADGPRALRRSSAKFLSGAAAGRDVLVDSEMLVVSVAAGVAVELAAIRDWTMENMAVDVMFAGLLGTLGRSVFARECRLLVLFAASSMALGAAPAAVELIEITGLCSGIDGGIDSTIELRLLECALVREFNSCSPEPACNWDSATGGDHYSQRNDCIS